MDLNEYIRQSYKRPNRKVLETLGASEDLIEYLMETPGNTNWNVINSIRAGDDDDIGEVWYIGTDGGDSGYGQFSFALIETDKANTAAILANINAYTVSMNGIELVVFQHSDGFVIFADNSDASQVTMSLVMIYDPNNGFESNANFKTDIAPTSVEVSVKEK